MMLATACNGLSIQPTIGHKSQQASPDIVRKGVIRRLLTNEHTWIVPGLWFVCKARKGVHAVCVSLFARQQTGRKRGAAGVFIFGSRPSSQYRLFSIPQCAQTTCPNCSEEKTGLLVQIKLCYAMLSWELLRILPHGSVSLDSTIVKVHPDGTGTSKKLKANFVP